MSTPLTYKMGRKPGDKCKVCGSSSGLVLHHTTLSDYDSVEKYLNTANIMVLCKGCHFKMHMKGKPFYFGEIIKKGV